MLRATDGICKHDDDDADDADDGDDDDDGDDGCCGCEAHCSSRGRTCACVLPPAVQCLCSLAPNLQVCWCLHLQCVLMINGQWRLVCGRCVVMFKLKRVNVAVVVDGV